MGERIDLDQVALEREAKGIDSGIQTDAVVEPRIVHQHIDAIKPGLDGGDGALEVGGIGEFAAEGGGATAASDDAVDDLLRLVGAAAENAGNGAFRGEGFGDGAADAFGAAGDDDNVVLKLQVHGEVTGRTGVTWGWYLSHSWGSVANG